MNSDDFLRLSEEVWPIQKNHLFMARKTGCPSLADLTHFGALVEREATRRALVGFDDASLALEWLLRNVSGAELRRIGIEGNINERRDAVLAMVGEAGQ